MSENTRTRLAGWFREHTQSIELPTPVPDAFDAVLTVPAATAHVTTRLHE